jgi:hypothetical protein
MFGGDSDAETITLASKQLGMSPFDIADEVGFATGKRQGAFTAGVSSGIDDLQGLGYSAVAAAADALSVHRVRDWANAQAQRNQSESQLSGRPDLEQVEDVWNKPSQWVPYAAYQVGKQVPNMAGAIAAGALMPEVAVPAALSRGAALLPRAFGGGGMASRVAAAAEAGGSEFAARRAALEGGQTFARQLTGGAAFNYGQGVGSLYQEANEGGDPNAGAKSLAGGVPYGLTETLPEAMLVGRFAHGSGFSGNILTRAAKSAGVQGAAGATSELTQNEMEMAYNGHVTPEQATSKRLNSGVAGGLVEGIVGSTGGLRRGHAPIRTVDDGPTDITQRDSRPLALTYDGRKGDGTLIVFPDGSTALPGDDLGHRYSDPDATRFGLVPQDQYPQGSTFTPRDVDTSNMVFRDGYMGDPSAPVQPANINTSGIQLDLTEPGPRPDFQLTQPAEPIGPQQPQVIPGQQLTEPVTPRGAQRGVPGQLPFSANTQSPKGQVLQGLVESLAAEGHMDMGTHSQASTLISKGQFAAAKKLVDVAVKEKQAADSMLSTAAKLKEKDDEADARATGSGTEQPAAVGGVQPAGSRATVGPVQDGRHQDTAAALVVSGEQADISDEPSTERHGPLAAVTSEALVEAADSAKDAQAYDTALDELYTRWRDEGDATAERYFGDNEKVPGFAADLARVRERAGEKAAAPPTPDIKKLGSEGKRGLKLGRVENGKLDEQKKETDSVLRGLVMPRLNSKTESTVAPESQLSDEQFEGVRQSVEAAVPNAPRIHIANDPSEIPGIEPAPAGVHPMGLLAKGKMFLFRNAIGSEIDALKTAFHELFHYGLRKALPAAQYYRYMAKLEAADGQVRAYAQRWRQSEEGVARRSTLSPELWNALAVEEGLADIAEEIQTGDRLGSKVRPGTIRRIVAWLADVANAVGMPKLGQYIRRLTLTDAQKFVADTLAAASQDVAPVKGSIADIFDQRAAQSPEPAKNKTVRKSPTADSFARVPYAHTGLGQKIQDALFNIAESPWALKWTTNDQIAEGYKDLKPVQDINRATQRMASVANRYLEVAAQTAKKWRAMNDDVQLAMQRIMLRSTMAEAHVSIKDEQGKYLTPDQAWNHEQNNHLDRTDAKVRATFDELYSDFHKLPAAAKAVYETVRDDLTRQHEDTLTALRKSVADQYAGQLSRALSDAELKQLSESDKPTREAFEQVLGEGGGKSEIRALAGMYQGLRDIRENFGTVRGPYFPLVRFGEHVVVMKGKALTDLELKATSLRTALQEALDENVSEEQVEAHDAKVDDLRARYTEANKAVEAAKQSDKNYTVEFHETPAQAERALQALRAKNPEADVYRSVREQYYRGLDGASGSFVRDLQDTVAAALDTGEGVSAEAKSNVLQSVKDLYMRRQPERSALRAELRRMNIEGVQSAQMLRGYAQAARNGAWRISRLTHAGDVTAGLQALSEDRRNPDAKHVLNELKARFVGDLVPPANNKFLQALSSGTYFMHLGFNLSYFATNATQSWVTSLPVMAGRHGIVNAANSLTAASKDVIRLLSQATAQSVRRDGKLVGLQMRLTDEQIASLAHDEGERAMLKTLTDDGVVDITIKHDLGAISDGSSNSVPGKVLELSSALANYPELYNRLATSLAAYRMEAARRSEGTETKEQVQERAEKYAEYIINRTHFNYSPENAPRMMRGQLGRLVFQFKRYQQGMIYLFAKLVKDATGGDKDSQRALAYLLGTTVATTGVVGLPIAAPVALAVKVLASAYPDDDEPEWLQQWYSGMKDAVGTDAAQVMAKGLPTLVGLDLSKKLGQGDVLNPMAFARTDGKKVFSRDYMTSMGFSLLGPGAALLANDAEAVGQAKDGNFLNAAKLAMPTFVSQALEAYRRADRGIVSTKGDTIMEPEEFNALATLAKAAGFEGVKVGDMYDQRSAYLEAVHNRTESRQALLRQYYEATRSGDSDAISSAREAINDFNGRQMADRIKGQDLASSLKTHAQRTRDTVEGLRVGKRDRDTHNRLINQ